MLRKVLLVMVLVALGVFGACGENGGNGATGVGRPTNEAADDEETEEAAIERYCDAVDAANERGGEIFGDVDQDDEEALAAAEREMLEYIQTTFPRGEELPDEIEDDFEAFLEGYELRVEEDRAEPLKEQQEAEKRLLKWEEEHCAK